MHDNIRGDQDSGISPPAVRHWRDVERAMERSRDSRAGFLRACVLGAFRRLRRGAHDELGSAAPGRPLTAARALLLTAFAAATGLVLTAGVGRAQEVRNIAALADGRVSDVDRALLAGLGLEPGAIESCEDVALLWRAVRELVLTQRVSEPMQQRILRRVWIADPAIRDSSVVESAVH